MYKNFVMQKYYDTSKKEELAAALASDNYVLQKKLDGAGYTLGVDVDGVPHLNNGKISKKTHVLIDQINNVPHLRDWAIAHMPPESQFCVEMFSHYEWKSTGSPVYMERERSTYSSSLLGSTLPAKSVARQIQSAPMQVRIFDCLFLCGQEIYKEDFAERWKTTVDFFDSYTNSISTPIDWIALVETVFEDKEDKIAEWLEQGCEGGVLKMLHSTSKVDASYHIREIGSTPARPRHTNYKIKEVDTVDAIITSIIPALRAYTGRDPENHAFKDIDGEPVNRLWKLGLPGSFGIGFYNDEGKLVETGSCSSGLNDEIRADMADDPEAFIGRVAELICMSKDTMSKTLRHPRLKIIREDKEAKECTFEATFN